MLHFLSAIYLVSQKQKKFWILHHIFSRILGPVSLGLNVNIPTVTANLHPEKDLPGEMTPGREVSKGICTIHNASKVKAQYKASTKQLMVNFSSAQITSVKRPESRSRDERVTEMKYGMIFSVSLNIGGRPRIIKVCSLLVMN